MEKGKYNELKNAIIKMCPDIVKLRWSCKMEFENDIWSIYIANTNNETGIFEIVNTVGEIKRISKEMIDFDKTIKIIGRDITLADILGLFTSIAMPELCLSVYGLSPQKATAELLLTRIAKLKQKERIILWNLANDNLDNQSDDTKKFLYKLIVE